MPPPHSAAAALRAAQAISSSSRASWRCSSSAIDASTSWRRAAIAAAWPLGVVVLTLGQRRLRDQRADAGVVGLVVELRQLLVDDGQLLPQGPQPLADAREPALDQPLRHRPQCRQGPDGRLGSHRRLLGRRRRLAHHGRRGPPGAPRRHGGRGRRAAVGPYWSIRHGEAHHLQSLCEVLLEDGTQLRPWPSSRPTSPSGTTSSCPRTAARPPGSSSPPAPAPTRRASGVGRPSCTRSTPTGPGERAICGDLKELVRWTGSLGGGAVLVNPLHANLPTLPQQPSPYYPASRRFRNVLYIRLADVPGATLVAEDLAEADAAGRALTGAARLDRDEVMALKLTLLERIFAALGARRRRRAVPSLARRAGPGARALDARTAHWPRSTARRGGPGPPS